MGAATTDEEEGAATMDEEEEAATVDEEVREEEEEEEERERYGPNWLNGDGWIDRDHLLVVYWMAVHALRYALYGTTELIEDIWGTT